MRAFYCDEFVLPLPEGHRFPMEKYRLLRECVTEYADVDLEVPAAASDDDLGRAHAAPYLDAVVAGTLTREDVRAIGFPWSPELVERSRRSVGGTLAAGRAALSDGAAVNLAGGTHHAFTHRGEGFCVFNDVAVTVRTLQAEGVIGAAAVLDLDVHQGNGTASIFAGDDSVFTLSVHGARNYPFRKEQSDLDLELEDGADDDAFLGAVEEGVHRALAGSPDVAFYLAGADPFQDDRLGRLGVSREGLARRDALVFEACRRRRTPLAVVMAGGYARDVADTVAIHAETVRSAADAARRWREPEGLRDGTPAVKTATAKEVGAASRAESVPSEAPS